MKIAIPKLLIEAKDITLGVQVQADFVVRLHVGEALLQDLQWPGIAGKWFSQKFYGLRGCCFRDGV